MIIDQPVFFLLPVIILYYVIPLYLGHYLGRSEKSPVNLVLPVIIIGLFYLVRPYEMKTTTYLLSIIAPSFVLLIAGYIFGVVSRKGPQLDTAPYIIGLTGLPCSGKSQAAEIMGKLGAKVIDVDRLGHNCLNNDDIRDRLAVEFGKDIITTENKVDRSKLGEIVFNSPAALKKLEGIIHPAMIKKIEEEIRFLEPEAVLVLDAAILHHMKLNLICKQVFVTYSDLSLREERASKRGWTTEDLKKRDSAVEKSLSYQNITLLINNEEKISLAKNIENIWKEILNER